MVALELFMDHPLKIPFWNAWGVLSRFKARECLLFHQGVLYIYEDSYDEMCQEPKELRVKDYKENGLSR